MLVSRAERAKTQKTECSTAEVSIDKPKIISVACTDDRRFLQELNLTVWQLCEASILSYI